MIRCIICHDTAKVPVQLICFPCASAGNETLQNECNEIVRVCLVCVRDYLQLDTAVNQRISFRKCLLCDRSVNPRHLGIHPDSIYRKDKMLMSMDNRNNISCSRVDDDCDFTGTQSELDRHLHDSCPGRTMTCRGGCGDSFKAMDEKAHMAACNFFSLCLRCTPSTEYMVEEDLRKHMFQKHKEVRCHDCKMYVPESRLMTHRKECPKRVVECTICKKHNFFVDMKKHISEHIRYQAQEINTATSHIQSQQTILKSALELFEKY